MKQTAHRDWYIRPRNPVQGWNYDGSRQPRSAATPLLLLYGPLLTCNFTASYGSLARFKDIQRLHKVGNSTVIGASGDMSDFQAIQTLLDEVVIDEFTHGDGHDLGPAEVHEYLSRVMYSRRSKIDPLWNSILVGGFRDGKRCVRPSSYSLRTSPCFVSCPTALCATSRFACLSRRYCSRSAPCSLPMRARLRLGQEWAPNLSNHPSAMLAEPIMDLEYSRL